MRARSPHHPPACSATLDSRVHASPRTPARFLASSPNSYAIPLPRPALVRVSGMRHVAAERKMTDAEFTKEIEAIKAWADKH